MALSATVYQAQIALSDVERGVYETLDLRLARHPSETLRYMLTRMIAYCLCYEEGIAFSKGGLSSTDEPPISVMDPTGRRIHWIDVGSPSAERLHKASKASERVSLFTSNDLAQLKREAENRSIFRADKIAIWQLEPGFLDAVEGKIDRKTKLELVRNEGRLYLTVGTVVAEGEISAVRLA
jgi:uncharacterized protein YaeQ